MTISTKINLIEIILTIQLYHRCDAALATISVIDAYAKKCVHFVVGPSCEYSVCERYEHAQSSVFDNTF